MDRTAEVFLRVLRCAIRGKKLTLPEEDKSFYPEIYCMASEHHILPLIADCLYDETQLGIAPQARQITASQAMRTAEFLLLADDLAERGLHPVVIKGIVCRSLYPEPELRPSEDEDLLVRPEESEIYLEALKAEGYLPEKDDAEDYEVLLRSNETNLCLELHTSLFPPQSEAYGDCNRFFEGALDRAVELTVEGQSVRTLAPTDHLLFLLCHAYKHFLHGGVGIRQLCDMELMAEKNEAQIDWAQIRAACEELHIAVFAAALFRIGEQHLAFPMPSVFKDIDVDENALLDDMLSGGLYGVVDVDRAHSSTMTLEAVTADREGRKRRGALHAVFLPLESMKGHFPYLREHPWLLPYAWGQRIVRYLGRKNRPEPVSPARSLQIAQARISLLRQYRIIK